MRPYEVMVIFDAGLEDDAVRGLVDRYPRSADASVFLEGYALGCACATGDLQEPDDT